MSQRTWPRATERPNSPPAGALIDVQRADRLLVADAPHGFGEQFRRRELADFRAGLGVRPKWNRVGNDYFIEFGFGDSGDRGTGKYRVRDVGHYLFRAGFLQSARGLA